MEFKDLLSLYFERSNAMQTFWGLYITIALGLLAFIGSVKVSRKKRMFLACILSAGFTGFAFVNAYALRDVTLARRAAYRLITDYRDKNPNAQQAIDQLKAVGRPFSEPEVVTFHVVCDFLELGAIWGLTLVGKERRLSYARTQP